MTQCSTWTEYITSFLIVIATGIAGSFMVLGYYYRYSMGKGGLVNETSIRNNTAAEYLIAKHSSINTIAIMLIHGVCLLSNRACCFCYKRCIIVTHVITALVAFVMMVAAYFSAAEGVQLQENRPGRTEDGNLRNVRGHAYLGLGVLVLYCIQCITGFVQIVKVESLYRIHSAMGVGIHVFILMTVVSALQTEQTRHVRSKEKYVPWTAEHFLHGMGAIATIISLIGVTLIILRKELNANHVMVVGHRREY